MINRVFVTGGCGFVGQSVVTHLVNAGFAVHVIDTDPSEYIDQLVKSNNNVFYWNKDFSEFEFHQYDLEYSAIIHLAAKTTIPGSFKWPRDYIDCNVRKFQQMLDRVRYQNPKIVFSSSSSVYGERAVPGTLETNPTAPTNLYSCTKLTGESLLESYTYSGKTTGVSLRFFNVAGADPNSKHGYRKSEVTHLIPSVINSVITGDEFILHGDGTAQRSFTHVDDIARAHIEALYYLDDLSEQESRYDVFNIGGNQCFSVNDVIDTTRQIFGLESLVVVADVARPGDSMLQSANSEKAKQILNWQPRFNLSDMLIHEYKFQKTNGLRKT